MTQVAGLVLAAGSGRRMGQPKAALVLDGMRLIDRAVLAFREAGCYPVFTVVRSDVRVVGARVVVNPAPERGMRSSLRLGVEAAGAVDAVAVTLVDTPGVGPRAISPVVHAWTPGRIGIATYEGRRAHPTVMSPALWLEALDLAGPDEGARALLAANGELIDEVAVQGDPSDLDTPEDLERWVTRLAAADGAGISRSRASPA